MSAIMKPILFLAMASVFGSNLALAQNLPTLNSDRNCSVGTTFHRQYIQSINQITRNTLSAFGTSHPMIQPLTTPLANGLIVNPILNRPGTNIGKLSEPILRVGVGMKIMARTLEFMVNRWDQAEAQFVSQNQANSNTRYTFISGVNAITSTVMTNLGRQYSEMLRLTNPLSITLTFNPMSLRGNALFNQNQSISTTGQMLKSFGSTLTSMVEQWEATSTKYLQHELLCL